MKKFFFPPTLAILLIVFGGFALYAVKQINNLKNGDSSLQASVKKNTEDLEATNRAAFTLPYEGYSSRRLTFDAESNRLYLPELKIKVPYSEKARSLLYSLRDNSDGGKALEADVTTDAYMPPQEMTILACADFLRLKIEDKQSPYNPAEKATSFKLGDGRTLQVYSFTGELEGNDQCKKTYEDGVSPKDFVEAFNGVESY